MFGNADMVHLAHIFIYPIKSLDGVEVSQASILASGAVKGDREFAIVDYQGKFVTGKRTAAIHHLRSTVDLTARTVSIWHQDIEPATFQLDSQRIPLEGWLSDYFGFPVKLIQNTEMGFPDDTDSPGPTIISTETLATVAEWFPDITLENVRQRLRTTLEITDAEPFWEDRLYAQSGQFVPFQLGNVQLMGVNPCQRCIVPTRNPQTGESYTDFQKIFLANRKATLPAWVETSRFKHFYRLAVNTRLAATESGKLLRVGDEVRLLP